MPALTLQTDPSSKPPSASTTPTFPPPPPPISPITPPVRPSSAQDLEEPNFALLDGRPLLTHTGQPSQQTTIPPPTAVALDLDTNPDAIALRSAIAILQLQQARATADMQTLWRAKEAALADPGGFVADLEAGIVGAGGNPVMGLTMVDSSCSSSEDDDEDDQDMTDNTNGAPGGSVNGDGNRAPAKRKPKRKPKTSTAPWANLPKPQAVVRCPPINWAQYGVVGESLDKLHAEQVAAPTPGTPATLGPGGTFEFKAGDSREPPGKRLVGIAAPYDPLKDKIEKKPKGPRR